MNEALAILGGNPINQFTFGQFPTVRDVLRFYIQFWKLKGSESRREKLVTTALIGFYDNLPLNTNPLINEQSIKNRLGRHVARLKSIVKNRSRQRSGWSNHLEHNFSSSLDSVFEITLQNSNSSEEYVSTSAQEETVMESEDQGTFNYSSIFVNIFLHHSHPFELKAAKKCH